MIGSQSVFVGSTAVLVYNPAPAGTPTVVIKNASASTLYLGQGLVTPTTGVTLPPGNTVSFTNAVQAIYAVAAGQTASATATTLAAATAAGDTDATLTDATDFAVGDTVIIGEGTGAESAVLATVDTETGAVTVESELLYDHATGSAVAVAVAGNEGGTLVVTAGTV